MARFEKKTKAGLPDWMGTYGDLVTLLLCFFIMMFATANVDIGKFDILVQAFNPSVFEKNGGKNIIGDDIQENDLNSILSDEIVYQTQLKSLFNELQEFVLKEGLENNIDLIKGPDNITIRFSSSLLFDSGKANLRKESMPYLKSIAKSFPNDFDIQIEGHTDNLPIHNNEFSSNWELSALRGVNVLKYLIENCNVNAKKISAAGYGEYRPIADNSKQEGKMKNRRVDIVLFKKY